MAKDQRTVLRRLFTTCYKILSDRLVAPQLERLGGDVLVIGAGKEPYRELVPNAAILTCTDIAASEQLDLMADAHALPFREQSFDAVILIDVLEHLQDPQQATAEQQRILRAGGVVMAVAPFLFHVHGDPLDFQRFTEHGLAVLFKDFSQAHIHPFGNRLHVILDILSTGGPLPALALRVFSHLLTLPPLLWTSRDCPSGYVVRAVK